MPTNPFQVLTPEQFDAKYKAAHPGLVSANSLNNPTMAALFTAKLLQDAAGSNQGNYEPDPVYNLRKGLADIFGSTQTALGDMGRQFAELTPAGRQVYAQKDAAAGLPDTIRAFAQNSHPVPPAMQDGGQGQLTTSPQLSPTELIKSMLGQLGGGNPFSSAYLNKALGQVDAGMAAASTPQTLAVDRASAPEMPTPQLPAPRDFSKSDAALAKLEPAVMTEKERQQIMRANLFQGLAQGLASLPEGASVGKVLAAVGAGALAGRGAGLEAVKAETDAFDEKLARYNLAVFNNELGKAQTLAEEARYQAETMNRNSLLKWSTRYEQWAKDNNVTVTNDAIISSRVGKDGKLEVTRTPLTSPLQASAAMAKAQMYMQASSEYNAGARSAATFRNGLIAQAAGLQLQQAMNGNQQDAAAAAITAPAFQARSIVENGLLGQVFDEKDLKAFTQEAQQQAVQMGLTPGTKEYAAGMQDIMTGTLTRIALGSAGNKQFMNSFAGAGAVGTQVYAADQFRNRQTRTQTGPKGTTTTVTQE